MKQLLTLFLLFTIYSGALCQDLVVTPEGDSLNCRITKIKDGNIYFTFRYKEEIRHTLIPLRDVRYQYGFYKNAEPIPDAPLTGNYAKWRIRLDAGPAFRIGKIADDLSQAEREYLQQLKSGFFLQAEATHFISESLGIGFRYSTFRSENQAVNLTIILPDGSSVTGAVRDDIRINFLGPSLITQLVSQQKKGAFVFDVTMGYLGYRNNATFNQNPLEITGSTLGYGLGIGYDVYLSKKVALGFSVGLITGTLTRLELNNGFSRTTVNLERGQYESLSRWDLGIGLRFY